MTVRVASFSPAAWLRPPSTDDGGKPSVADDPDRASGSAPAARSAAAGPYRVVASRIGPRQASIELGPGGCRLSLAAPPIRTLVLSGGGAKGAAYSGVVRALEKQGALAGIRDVYGASAGAISAALIASGIDAARFDALTDGLDFLALLHGQADPTRPEGFVSGNAVPLLGRLPFKNGVLGKLGANGVPLEVTIRRETCAALMRQLDRALADSPDDEDRRALSGLRDRLAATGVVTFGLLRDASRLVPEIKALHCSVVLKDRPPQLMMLSADTVPDLDIAEAARASAGLPVVFGAKVLDTAFHADGTAAQRFIDGGCLLNTPSPSLIDAQGEEFSVPDGQQLILMFEYAPASPKSSLSAELGDRLAGVENTAWNAWMEAQLAEPALRAQTVVMPLDTELGDFTRATTDFSMSARVKDHLQQLSYLTVMQHLHKQQVARIGREFDSLDQCLLALDPATLQALDAQGVAGAAGTLAFREALATQLGRLSAHLDSERPLSPRDHDLGALLFGLEALLEGRAERQAYLARLLNDARGPLSRLVETLPERPALVSPALSQAILAERERRDVAAVALRIQRAVLYPAQYLYGQKAANIELLRAVSVNVGRAQRHEELVEQLRYLQAAYQSRWLPLAVAPQWSSLTLARIQAWLDFLTARSRSGAVA